jgi:hypothetical protein
MVAVVPDLREFCVSAVEQMAIDNKLLANSDELTINEAAYIYEQFIAGLWNSPLAQSDPDMWARALKYAKRAAAVAALHYLEQRLSTQHEHKLAGECDCVETDTQRQRQQIQPTHTEVQTVDLAGDQAGAVRHDEAEERYEQEGLAVMCNQCNMTKLKNATSRKAWQSCTKWQPASTLRRPGCEMLLGVCGSRVLLQFQIGQRRKTASDGPIRGPRELAYGRAG